MLPKDLIDTTLKKPGRVYLAEAHSFGGNSGSPMFVDINKFQTSFGFNYKFLGVVAGYVPEDNDFTFQASPDYSGKVKANSGICIVVPAEELKRILYSQNMTKGREDFVAQKLLIKKQTP